MDEFTEARYNQIAKNFVDIYINENKLLAAKMVAEQGVPEKDYPILREKINRTFLSKGWTFEE